MRAKTLLLTAALSAVSIAAAVAQTVYSVNAVGYVNVTVPAGKFALLNNPLNQPTNSLAAVLPSVPNNTVVYVFDPTTGTFTQTTLRAGTWTGAGASATLNPGQGFFIKNAGTSDMTVTFVGEVPQGTNLTINFPKAGFYLVGSIVPQAGAVQTVLGLPAVNGDKLYQFNPATQLYTTYTKRTGTTWTGGTGEPNIGVAEAFFYQASAAGTWTRSFSVNQ